MHQVAVSVASVRDPRISTASLIARQPPSRESRADGRSDLISGGDKLSSVVNMGLGDTRCDTAVYPGLSV